MTGMMVSRAVAASSTRLSHIVRAAARLSGNPASAITGKSRQAHLTRVRCAIAVVARSWPSPPSYPQIGMAMGGRDHSSVIHNFKVGCELLSSGDDSFGHFVLHLRRACDRHEQLSAIDRIELAELVDRIIPPEPVPSAMEPQDAISIIRIEIEGDSDDDEPIDAATLQRANVATGSELLRAAVMAQGGHIRPVAVL